VGTLPWVLLRSDEPYDHTSKLVAKRPAGARAHQMSKRATSAERDAPAAKRVVPDHATDAAAPKTCDHFVACPRVYEPSAADAGASIPCATAGYPQQSASFILRRRWRGAAWDAREANAVLSEVNELRRVAGGVPCAQQASTTRR
jgi:hypothetical protein